MALDEKLKAFVSQLEGIMDDLTTIDVVTMTGGVEMAVNTGNKPLDPTALYKDLIGQVNGKLSVVAVTHVGLDMDRINIYTNEANEKLVALHNESVKAAIEARKAVLDLVKGLIKWPSLPND